MIRKTLACFVLSLILVCLVAPVCLAQLDPVAPPPEIKNKLLSIGGRALGILSVVVVPGAILALATYLVLSAFSSGEDKERYKSSAFNVCKYLVGYCLVGSIIIGITWIAG